MTESEENTKKLTI